MSLINTNDFAAGIDELLLTLEIDANYKKSLYLVIALAYKRLQKYDEAIEIVTSPLFSSIKAWNFIRNTMIAWSTGASCTSRKRTITWH